MISKSSPSEVFLENGVLKICRKFTAEHPCRSATSIKLLCNFIEIALQHGCYPVDLLHIFTAPFPKNTSGQLLLDFDIFHIPYYFIILHIHLSLMSFGNLQGLTENIELKKMLNVALLLFSTR